MTDIYTSVARDAWHSGRTTRMTLQITSNEGWLQHLRTVRVSIARNRDAKLAQAEQLTREAEELSRHLERWDELIVQQEANPTQAPLSLPPQSPAAVPDGAVRDGAQAAPSTTTAVDPPPGNGVGALISGTYARVPSPEPGQGEDDAAAPAPGPEGGAAQWKK